MSGQRTIGGELSPTPQQCASLIFCRAIVKSYVPGIIFFLFNVTFISFIQSVLLFAISAVPAYAILLSAQFESDVTAADVCYLVVELGLVLSEWFSDGQQWSKYLVILCECLGHGKLTEVTSLPNRQASVPEGCQITRWVQSG